MKSPKGPPPIVYHPQCDLSLQLYGIEVPLLDQRALACFQWLQRHVSEALEFSAPEQWPALGPADFLRVHAKEYISSQQNPQTLENALESTFELRDPLGRPHRYFPEKAQRPLTELHSSILWQVRGTMYALDLALQKGWSYFLGGGMHHAMSFGGRGFCHYHDGIIALRKAQHEGRIQRAWIVDLDAHKGDGSAEILQNDPSILTLSLHMEKGWPLDTAERDPTGELRPWFIPSTLDVPIAAHEGTDYLKKLEGGLEKLWQVSQEKWGTGVAPDIAWIVDGSDPFEGDILPSTQHLRLTKGQMLERSLFTDRFLRLKGIKRAYVFGGGYGELVHEIHARFIQELCQLD